MATFPSSAKFNGSTIKAEQNVYRATFGDKSTRQRAGVGQRFQFSLSTPPVTKTDMWEVFAFLNNNQGGTFYIVHPQYTSPLGAPGGTPRVNGASQAGKSLVTDGWTASTAGLLKAGDVFNIAGIDKVYMCAADVNSDAGGNATVSLTTSLISSPADNALLTTSSVQFLVAMQTPMQEYAANVSGLYQYSVNLIEAF